MRITTVQNLYKKNEIIKIRQKKLLSYLGLKDFSKHNKTNQGFDGLLKKERAYKPSHHLVLYNIFQSPNFVQQFSPQ